MDSGWSIKKTINNPFATGIMSSNWNIKYLSRPKRGPHTLFWPTSFAFIITFFFFLFFFKSWTAYLLIMKNFIAVLLFGYLYFLRLMYTCNSTVRIDLYATHPCVCVRVYVCVCVCVCVSVWVYLRLPFCVSSCLSNGVDRLWIIAVISCSKM